MIVKKHILKTLNRLDVHYNKALTSPVPEDPIFFSKLATLEYCGWIEESFDKIVRRSVKGQLQTTAFKDSLEGSIKSTYGFQYVRHFKPLLTKAIGLKKMEEVEKHLKHTGQFEALKGALETIKEQRDDAAHTWLGNQTKPYPAPSAIKFQFQTVFPIMKDIYSKVCKL